MAYPYKTINCQVDVNVCIKCHVCSWELEVTDVVYDINHNPHFRVIPCECNPPDVDIEAEMPQYDALRRLPLSENTIMINNLWESTLIDIIKEHTKHEGNDFWDMLKDEMESNSESNS
tara:strand:+ start:684 stop:1037 length:354 start_codon:yes stop_codon:yes gene_type:complete